MHVDVLKGIINKIERLFHDGSQDFFGKNTLHFWLFGVLEEVN
jgi:hypothetical protein